MNHETTITEDDILDLIESELESNCNINIKNISVDKENQVIVKFKITR